MIARIASKFLRGPWFAGMLLAVALAPDASGQAICAGVQSQRTSADYYEGLLYALGGTPQIIRNTNLGPNINELILRGGLAPGYWSYQETPYSVTVPPLLDPNGLGQVISPAH